MLLLFPFLKVFGDSLLLPKKSPGSSWYWNLQGLRHSPLFPHFPCWHHSPGVRQTSLPHAILSSWLGVPASMLHLMPVPLFRVSSTILFLHATNPGLSMPGLKVPPYVTPVLISQREGSSPSTGGLHHFLHIFLYDVSFLINLYTSPLREQYLTFESHIQSYT